PELHDRAHRRIVFDARQRLLQRYLHIRLAAVRLLQGVDQVRHVADPEPAEVDDDVVALGSTLLIERSQRERVDEQVTVVADLQERHRIAARIRNLELDEPGHAGAQEAEAVLGRQYFHERSVLEVHGLDIAEEAVRRKDVEEHLAVRIECEIRNNEVDVEVDVAPAPAVERAAGQTEIDAKSILEGLVATVFTAVHGDHAEIAFVDVLGREEEPMVV